MFPGQLNSHLSELQEKKIKLDSRIKMDERELDEINALIDIMQKGQNKCASELSDAEYRASELKKLASDIKTEEKNLISKTRVTSQYLNTSYSKSLNKFALAEKEGIRGYSSGQGTTCTRQEAMERDRRSRQVRTSRLTPQTR